MAGGSGLSVRMEADTDTYPLDSDMIFTWPRPLLRAEKPFVRLWLWIPPDLPTAPNGYGKYQYFGFRVTITQQDNALIWPGIWIGRYNGSPWFFSRVALDVPIAPASAGWWTLGLSWTDEGVMEFYVSAGRVENPQKVAQDDYVYPTHMVSVSGHFLALRAVDSTLSPNFVLNWLDVRALLPLPMLLPSRDPFAVTLEGGYPTEPYDLEYSPDLNEWSLVGFIRDGESRNAGDGFYRASQY